jgi:hypothetical protein
MCILELITRRTTLAPTGKRKGKHFLDYKIISVVIASVEGLWQLLRLLTVFILSSGYLPTAWKTQVNLIIFVVLLQ